jgi:hypothetical protein
LPTDTRLRCEMQPAQAPGNTMTAMGRV